MCRRGRVLKFSSFGSYVKEMKEKSLEFQFQISVKNENDFFFQKLKKQYRVYV